MLREPVFEPIEQAADEDDPEGLLGTAAGRLLEGAAHSGAMVALYPDAATAAELAISDGEDADELHLTLAFLGEAEKLNLTRALQVVAEWAAACPPSLSGEISGVGQFATGPVTYLSVDLPDLPPLRERLVDGFDAAGVPPKRDHGFTPHITLDYARRRPKMDRPIPIRFDRATLAWAGSQFSFPLGVRSAVPLQEARMLLEGKWDASLHPRWPKGTPRAGEFMRVGQRFIGSDGKEWQIAHIAGGKVIANRAEGKYAETETGVFHPEKVKGGKSPLEGGEETHVIADVKKEAAPRKVQGGKGKGATVPIVDPYVDGSSHDASLPVPAGSKVSAEEWKRFGKIDQEHYAELMQRFGKYSPGKAKSMIDEAYKDYEAEIQAIVKNAYSAQYGSSSGFTLSLTGVFKAITGQDKKELAKLDAQRQRALELQGRHKDVIAWDLYNRTRSPDVAVFHKSNDPPSYWQEFIQGNRPVMSGLSQSFNFGANFGFGSNTLATPLAIRHVLMSSYSAQPIPGQTHFAGELEISVAEQLKIDNRSITFSLHDITANQKKWLMGVTKAPTGGDTVERFKEALQSGEMLPTPPAPPDIQMQGEGQKLWIDPPPEAADYIERFADKLPAQQGSPLDPGKLDKKGPWAFKDAGGLPKATVAKESEYKPGDYMLGLKGTLYIVVEDPGDPTGFGLRYVKIENGKFSGESYNFEGGGGNQYFKLSAHYELPDPHKEAKASDLFDPHAWVNGEKEKFVGKLEPGDKFKVNGSPYEVKAQLSGAQTQITDLTSGKVGTINTDYKTHVLVPKEGYVPEAPEGEKLAPAKGMTLAYDGTKHVVTTILKDGTVKAKPTGGGKTVAIAADDPELDNLYDPTAHKIGAKIKAGDLAVGQLFHGGRGSTQRPYVITGAEGNKVTWRSLDTGEEGIFTKAKQVRLLDDAEAPEPEAEQPSVEPISHDQLKPGDSTTISNLKAGDFFSVDGEVFNVVWEPPTLEDNAGVAKVMPSGEIGAGSSEGAYPDKLVTYTGTAPPLPATDMPEGGFPDLVAEGGFDPYKSKYGSGGKYTHDKLGEMVPGTIFRDKGGKLWKIKEADHAVIVTDGNVLYTADASLRGRVVQAEFVDTTGPVKGPHADPQEVAAAEGLAPNSKGLTMADLPAGATVLVNGEVQVVKAPAEPGDEVSALAASTELADGGENLLGPAIIPDQIKLPPKVKSLGALKEGDTFAGADGKQHIVVAKSVDGDVVVKTPGGQLWKLPPSTPRDAVDAGVDGGLAAPPKPAPPPGDLKVADLEDGAVFMGAGGELNTVVAKTVDGGIVVMKGDKPGGEMTTLPGTAVIKASQVDVEAEGGVAGIPSEGEWSEAVQQALGEAGVTMEEVPVASGIEGYKSKWGSGGKYQHYMLSELEPGAVFVDKQGNSYTVVGGGPKGSILVLGSASGLLSLAPAGLRAKRLES